jgi:hypothetical protein
VNVKIIEIDPDRRRLSLSLRRVEPGEAVKTIDVSMPGSTVSSVPVPELGSDEVFGNTPDAEEAEAAEPEGEEPEAGAADEPEGEQPEAEAAEPEPEAAEPEPEAAEPEPEAEADEAEAAEPESDAVPAEEAEPAATEE